ncbi:unnamed protein product [Symbiodinium natans]|uniref:Uncharacterized protein n=1 Tax=Symbiodinium natans TaxID=878477 RepID=A0A812N9B4_9DINO|nr:unnamed protein product [Symbiodinium natans]
MSTLSHGGKWREVAGSGGKVRDPVSAWHLGLSLQRQSIAKIMIGRVLRKSSSGISAVDRFANVGQITVPPWPFSMASGLRSQQQKQSCDVLYDVPKLSRTLELEFQGFSHVSSGLSNSVSVHEVHGIRAEALGDSRLFPSCSTCSGATYIFQIVGMDAG